MPSVPEGVVVPQVVFEQKWSTQLGIVGSQTWVTFRLGNLVAGLSGLAPAAS